MKTLEQLETEAILKIVARLKDLEKQLNEAKERILELAVKNAPAWMTDMGQLYPDIEKFAELIVRECINIGDNYEEILGNEPECFNCRKVAYGIVDKIKNHFGVKQ